MKKKVKMNWKGKERIKLKHKGENTDKRKWEENEE